ncbi:hypothetical protein G5C51_20645 [Streptomyces sp. A7024]|uniref:Uncharacterized protein n=1 Tax=Streptomyces coryli TaxID=1128680 RepID=A0A6G4U4T6_9ACTN|nr:hypothetical protein [Streptomyces coryli]NGN66297.1 hypothetical protein [Streptomyces coryli]
MTGHPYFHERTHATRSTELQAEARAWERSAARHPKPAAQARIRLGWLLVETGLRLVRTPAATAS